MPKESQGIIFDLIVVLFSLLVFEKVIYDFDCTSYNL